VPADTIGDFLASGNAIRLKLSNAIRLKLSNAIKPKLSNAKWLNSAMP
jgi:hypothetical protein